MRVLDDRGETGNAGGAHSNYAERKGAQHGGEGPAPPASSYAAVLCGTDLDRIDAELAGDDVTPAQRLADLRAAIGYRAPRAAAAAHRADREAAKRLEAEEATRRERARQLIREQLGEWSKDSAKRLAQTKPSGEVEARDAKRLGKHAWAINRMTTCGSQSDLAYACERMTTLAPVEAIGCWIVEAMGLNESGVAVRQLYSPKARRKLARSFALWMCGEDTRLRQVAGSPSRRTVRGVYRAPQAFLARITGMADRPWSRATTTRDANESHAAGLFRRVRLPRSLVHESERCGASKQVVSRYWMELPRQPRQKRRSDLPDQLGAFFSAHGVATDALAWAREQGKQAIVYALHSVATLRRSLVELASVPGMLAPLLRAPP